MHVRSPVQWLSSVYSPCAISRAPLGVRHTVSEPSPPTASSDRSVYRKHGTHGGPVSGADPCQVLSALCPSALCKLESLATGSGGPTKSCFSRKLIGAGSWLTSVTSHCHIGCLSLRHVGSSGHSICLSSIRGVSHSGSRPLLHSRFVQQNAA